MRFSQALFLSVFITFIYACSAFAIEVDLSSDTFSPTETIESVRLHFIRVTPIDLRITGLNHDFQKSEQFLDGITKLIDRIGPRGTITLEKTRISAAEAF